MKGIRQNDLHFFSEEVFKLNYPSVPHLVAFSQAIRAVNYR